MVVEPGPQTALAASRSAFESWAHFGPGQLPDNAVDAMQVQLMRWQQINFGSVSPVAKHDIQMTLGLIEEFGELAEAKVIHGKHGKLDALGDICVYAGQLCISHRLAVRPIMELGEALFEYWTDEGKQDLIPHPMVVVGNLSHITLKRDQKIRGYDNDEKFWPAFVTDVAHIMALAKLEIWCSSDDPDYNEADEPAQDIVHVEWDGLIISNYMDVGAVVLQRNWNKDKLAGVTG